MSSRLDQDVVSCCTNLPPANWKLWSRDTQKVYALSDGTRTEERIALLLGRTQADVHTILSVLFLSGYITLQRGGHDVVDFALLETSYQVIVSQQKAFLFDFRLAIFERPDVFSLFSSPHFESNFLQALHTILLKMQRHDPSVFQFVQQLGARHEKYGVTREHFRLVGGFFLTVLQRYVGVLWTRPMQRTWEALFGVLTDVMLFGYGQFTV